MSDESVTYTLTVGSLAALAVAADDAWRVTFRVIDVGPVPARALTEGEQD